MTHSRTDTKTSDRARSETDVPTHDASPPSASSHAGWRARGLISTCLSKLNKFALKRGFQCCAHRQALFFRWRFRQRVKRVLKRLTLAELVQANEASYMYGVHLPYMHVETKGTVCHLKFGLCHKCCLGRHEKTGYTRYIAARLLKETAHSLYNSNMIQGWL